jgi:hypothetical protein
MKSYQRSSGGRPAFYRIANGPETNNRHIGRTRVGASWNRKTETGLRLLACVFGMLLIPSLVLAGPITLTPPYSGSVSLGGAQLIGVNGVDIDFGYSGGTTLYTGNVPVATGTVTGTGDTGVFDVNSGNGSFSGLGATVTLANLNIISEPVGSSADLTDFVQFSSPNSGWTITLTELEAGTGTNANCAGGTGICTPTGSPFNLTNGAGNTVGAQLFFLGTFIDTTDGNSGNVTGTFSTTFSGTTVQSLLAALGAGQSVVSSASGTLAITSVSASSVPEPGTAGTMLLAGGGLLLLSRLRRQRKP